MTAIVLAFAVSAPWWAAVSIPLARPEEMVKPAEPSRWAKREACSFPYRLHLREPTIATFMLSCLSHKLHGPDVRI